MNKIYNELFGSSLSDIEDSPRKIHKVKSVIVKVQKDGNNNVIKPGSDKLTSARSSSTKIREVERKSQSKRKPEAELQKKTSKKPKIDDKSSKRTTETTTTSNEPEISPKAIKSLQPEPIKPEGAVQLKELKATPTDVKIFQPESIKVEYKRPAAKPSGKLLNFMKMYESMKTTEVEFSDSESDEEIETKEINLPTPAVSVQKTEDMVQKTEAESTRMISPAHQVTKIPEIVTEVKTHEIISKVEESIKVNITVPQRLEPQTRPQVQRIKPVVQPTQRLFSLPRRIQHDSNNADESLNERVMRLYESFKESTEGIRLYENAIQQPQQAVIPRAEYAVKVAEPKRQPKRKWEFPIDIPQPTLTTTKPENFRFNRQNPKAFTADNPTKSKGEFKVPDIPKVEIAKPLNTFQRRMMNKNAIKSSIQKCNQVKNQSETEQAAKRFKSLEAEKMMKEIDEFFRIPELLQPIYDVPCKVMEFYSLPELVQPISEVPEKIADYYNVPKLLEPIQELSKKKRGRPAKKIPKLQEPIQSLPNKKRGRPAKGTMRQMVNNYAANAENLVRGTCL